MFLMPKAQAAPQAAANPYPQGAQANPMAAMFPNGLPPGLDKMMPPGGMGAIQDMLKNGLPPGLEKMLPPGMKMPPGMPQMQAPPQAPPQAAPQQKKPVVSQPEQGKRQMPFHEVEKLRKQVNAFTGSSGDKGPKTPKVNPEGLGY